MRHPLWGSRSCPDPYIEDDPDELLWCNSCGERTPARGSGLCRSCIEDRRADAEVDAMTEAVA